MQVGADIPPVSDLTSSRRAAGRQASSALGAQPPALQLARQLADAQAMNTLTGLLEQAYSLSLALAQFLPALLQFVHAAP